MHDYNYLQMGRGLLGKNSMYNNHDKTTNTDTCSIKVRFLFQSQLLTDVAKLEKITKPPKYCQPCNSFNIIG